MPRRHPALWQTQITPRHYPMSKTSLKNVQKQKKKARRTLARPTQTRIQGNTAGVRKRLKKLSGKARATKASA
jgi:hypothetical protein